MSPPVGVLLRKINEGCSVKNTIAVVTRMMTAANIRVIRRSKKITSRGDNDRRSAPRLVSPTESSTGTSSITPSVREFSAMSSVGVLMGVSGDVQVRARNASPVALNARWAITDMPRRLVM